MLFFGTQYDRFNRAITIHYDCTTPVYSIPHSSHRYDCYQAFLQALSLFKAMEWASADSENDAAQPVMTITDQMRYFIAGSG